MPETQIFESTNHYTSRQTQGGGAVSAIRNGWCAAASALWCKSRVAGDPIAHSRPDTLRMGILQVRYRWDPAGGGQDFINLHTSIESTAVLSYQNLGLEAFLTALVAAPAVYHIDTSGHSMAVDTRGTFYFYDIENGLFRYSDSIEWKAGIRRRYNAVAQWMAFTVT